MSRQAVTDAGGPSISTQQRIERGISARDIETETRAAYETALQLPSGWITDYLAGRIETPVADDPVAVMPAASGARLLVGIAEGLTRLTDAELAAIEAVIAAIKKGS